MRILILSNPSSTRRSQIQAELMRRGHEVQFFHVQPEDFVSLQHTPLKRWQLQKKCRAEILKKRPEALKKQLETNSYDVILVFDAPWAEVLSELHQEMYLALMIYISDENDFFRRKQALSYDVYIVRSETEKNALLRRGIGSTLVHVIDISQQDTAQICEIIEEESKQWEELKGAFMCK